MNDPHTKTLDSFLLSNDPLVAAKHAQGELVDPWLQHGAKLLLEVGGLVLKKVIDSSIAFVVGVKQTIRVCYVVIIVGLDQGEEFTAHIVPLLCLWGGGAWGGCPLGTTSPSGKAEAAPAGIPRNLTFASWAFTNAFLIINTSAGAGHFNSLHWALLSL